jgi:hypothetical protein
MAMVNNATNVNKTNKKVSCDGLVSLFIEGKSQLWQRTSMLKHGAK